MNSLLAQATAFALGCAVTAAAWMLVRPAAPPPGDPPGHPPRRQQARWHPDDLQPALAATQAAKSPAEQAAAAIRLARIPADQIPKTIANITLVENNRLTLAAKTLLVRWGETDGEAAVVWAGKHLQGQSLWSEAFRQIGPAWAWTHPEAMAAWMLQRHASPPSADSEQAAVTLRLDHSTFCRACGWLAPEVPLLATRLIKQRGGWSEGRKFAHTLKTTTQVLEALGAFDNLEQLSIWEHTAGQSIAHELLNRWNELDPQDFAASPYASVASGTGYERIVERTHEWFQSSDTDRAAAATRFLDASPSADRKAYLYQLTHQWTKSDPDTVTDWITSLPAADQPLALQTHTQLRAASNLQDTVTWISVLPGSQQAACLVVAYDTWNASDSNDLPDQSGWTPALRQAWADLDSLAPASGP